MLSQTKTKIMKVTTKVVLSALLKLAIAVALIWLAIANPLLLIIKVIVVFVVSALTIFGFSDLDSYRVIKKRKLIQVVSVTYSMN